MEITLDPDPITVVVVLAIAVWLIRGERRARSKRRTWQYHDEWKFTYEVRYVIRPNWEEIFASILGPIEEGDLLSLAILREYLTLLSEEDEQGAAAFLASLKTGPPKDDSLGLLQLIWRHNQVINLKVWYDRDDEPIRIYSDVAGEMDDEFVEEELWPMVSFLKREPGAKALAQVEEVWPPLRELLCRDAQTRTSMEEWLVGNSGTLRLSPWGVEFPNLGEVIEDEPGHVVGFIPIGKLVELLLYLEGFGSPGHYQIAEFPKDIAQSLQEHGVEYEPELGWKWTDYGSFDPEASLVKLDGSQEGIAESGISLRQNWLDRHWFSVKGVSVGVSVRFFDRM